MYFINNFIQNLCGDPSKFISIQKKSFIKSYTIINFYYAFVFFIVVASLSSRDKWLATKSIDPLWPLFWVNHSNYESAVNFILLLAVFSSLLCLVLQNKRFIRLLVFISLLLLVTLQNSFGKINHGNHVLLYISFLLIFLPDKKKDLIENSIYQRQLFINTVFASQVLFMLTYTLSGFWKIVSAIQQFMHGEINAFSPNALALLIYKRLNQANKESIFGGYIVDHPLIGWPLYVSAIFIEFFSVVAVFRPSVHRLWGIFLIMMHLSIYFTMTINFAVNIFLLALFFVLSPFYPERIKLLDAISNLPVLSFVCASFKYVKSRIN